ncbi:MAG: hypothetical protein HQK51_20650 [Oligoflexia bacterium]|nr:hypothetical protein [Oligoflexia bacterium]
MKIKCVCNKLSDIKQDAIRSWLKKDYIHLGDDEPISDLEVGKEYTVYGVTYWDNSPWFYICDDGYDYPVPKYSGFFDIVDNRLSRYWELSIHVLSDGRHSTSLVFPEWAKERCFYERLSDGEKTEVALFLKYQKLMEVEYPTEFTGSKSIKDFAELLDHNWIMCPHCSESWEEKETTVVTACPSCSKQLLNPHRKK